MRPRLTAMPPIPLPIPVAFHTSGGPSLGHSWRRPVSLETALRSGPCHCGQSAARADGAANDERTDAANASGAKEEAESRRMRSFMFSLLRVGAISFLPRVRHSPDGARAVVGDHQRPVFGHGHARG